MAGILLGLTACHSRNASAPSIVGTWVVRIPEAPFPLHMFVFHGDGTVVQSNPDAGNASRSDSNAMGVWVRDGDRFKGRIVEITADRTTHHFVSRGEITFTLTVDGDRLRGNAEGNFFGVDGKAMGEAIHATLDGERVRP